MLEYYNRVRQYSSFCIIAKPKNDDEIALFWHLARRVYNTTVIVDEIDRYCGPAHCQQDLWEIINYGRHNKISLIGMARRPARVNRDFTANADWLAVFQTSEKTDKKYLSDYVDVDGLEDLQTGIWPNIDYRFHGETSITGLTENANRTPNNNYGPGDIGDGPGQSSGASAEVGQQ